MKQIRVTVFHLITFTMIALWILCEHPVSALAAEAASGKCGDNITWSISESGILTISGTGDMYDYESEDTGGQGFTPWYYNGTISIADGESVRIQSVIIEPGVTKIGSYVFHNCKYLRAVSIPDSVVKIGKHAFDHCEVLEKLEIPSGVTEIGEDICIFCYDIRGISVSKDNRVYDSRDNCNAIIKTAEDVLVLGCGNTVIPPVVTAIGDYAFFECKNLRSINIPDSVTKIGEFAFSGCANLGSLEVPDSVTDIGRGAFALCSSLESVKLSNNINHIPAYAFTTCDKIKNVNIPDGVKVIGSYAFSSCSRLNTVYLPGSVISIGEYAFGSCNALSDIYYRGYEDEWNGIYIENSGNKALFDASFHFYEIVPVTGVMIKCGENSAQSIAYSGDAGSKIQLEAIVVPENANNKNVSWTSSDAAIAAVDGNGLVQLNKKGTAVIIATTSEGKYNAVCVITVADNRKSGEEDNEIPAKNGFTDVTDPSRFYYKPVYWAVENGITSGTTATTFAPDDICTRAQIVTFLYRAAGQPEVEITATFNDVPHNAYYAKAVSWAVANGVTSGTSFTTFSPDAPCTRAQAVTFMYRAAKQPDTSISNRFTDVPNDKYYAKAVAWAAENGITSGATATTFNPNESCTRGQIVTFIYRSRNSAANK